MTMPFYVPPEQLIKDRADFARRNVARGRPVVALEYEGGIAFDPKFFVQWPAPHRPHQVRLEGGPPEAWVVRSTQRAVDAAEREAMDSHRRAERRDVARQRLEHRVGGALGPARQRDRLTCAGWPGDNGQRALRSLGNPVR